MLARAKRIMRHDHENFIEQLAARLLQDLWTYKHLQAAANQDKSFYLLEFHHKAHSYHSPRFNYGGDFSIAASHAIKVKFDIMRRTPEVKHWG